MRDGFLAALNDWHMPRIPVGEWFSDGVDWLKDKLGAVFDAISEGTDSIVSGLADVLQWPPSWVMFLVFALLALWLRGWKFALTTLLGFALIDALGAFDSAMQTLALVLLAAVISVILAVPLGVLAARSDTASRIIKPIMDFLQTVPQFVYLIPAVIFFGIGVGPGVVATVMFALAPGVRLTELGIRQVDREMVEAGEAFGSPPMKILREIQLPLAMPSIMAGVNQIIMLSLSMVVIAGMVGAPGLGAQVFEATTRLQLGVGFEYGLSVVILAIYLDRLTASLSDRSAVSRARRLAGKA
ncbi:ABC transporter permease [Saccharomonospora viridis]|jgi:glycine betaine/proline transport system permease protein|uniref:ABC-type proline/glycine betaine transport system, permease component n=2 Tax=Saccharomonospora viridis TaxID=1852 RepID=C7MS87_SACVD|nr:proline/glycine betaine ABC transporter permease [Saccharomonospora viridis]ACU95200.1 ABC-type proline/glycine betaine transport system, permease component [Saccharomonospora viridis DSM 43017]KHF44833.1 glycine/betaine ABC transporter permease [Saccharomonospora viridis]SFP19729.1 glycine betaine/proline transport system permease protein [Saccharomonospora viridis]